MDLAPLLKLGSQPLQTLSPERVNGTRPLSNSAHKTSKTAGSKHPAGEPQSPFASPTRKVNLLADYNPHKNSKTESGFTLAQSPTIGDINAFRTHARTNSDVQGLVKRFEHLDVRDRDAESAEKKRKHEAELHRAQIAREEAETDARRLREEVRRLKKENDEGRDRERKVGKRLEVVMEEYASCKDSHASQSATYEKEVRKARKEAFKSSSAVVKLQEELKGTRSTLLVAQSTLDMEKRKTQQRDQDTFNAQYKMVALQEEVDKLQSQLAIVEEEKQALKTSLEEEEVARIAAEGMIALPATGQDDDEDLLFSPSKRSPRKKAQLLFTDDDDKENQGGMTKKSLELKTLLQDLTSEREKREQAEDMAEFLRLECQFRCCSCRSTPHPSQNSALNLSEDIAEGMSMIRQDAEDVLEAFEYRRSAGEAPIRDAMIAQQSHDHSQFSQRISNRGQIAESPAHSAPEPMDEDMEDDMSCTIRPEPTRHEAPAEEQASIANEPDTMEVESPKVPRPIFDQPSYYNDIYEDSPMPGTTNQLSLGLLRPEEPAMSAHDMDPPRPHQQYSVRTVTTTTTIPMQFTPVRPTSRDIGHSQHGQHYPVDAEEIPPTTMPFSGNENAVSDQPFDRAAALAAIAYRRGRAKSIANGQMTPRKQMLEGVGLKDRRDISAPLLGQQLKKVAAEADEARKGTSLKGSSSVGRAAARKAPF